MNDVLLGFCLLLFIILPPALLMVRFIYGKPSWWLLVIVVVLFGWLSWFGVFMFYQLGISEMIMRGEEPPDGWDSDGAAGLFAIFSGWLMAITYFIPWLVLYLFIAAIKSMMSSRKAPNE